MAIAAIASLIALLFVASGGSAQVLLGSWGFRAKQKGIIEGLCRSRGDFSAGLKVGELGFRVYRI